MKAAALSTDLKSWAPTDNVWRVLGVELLPVSSVKNYELDQLQALRRASLTSFILLRVFKQSKGAHESARGKDTNR
jgi:hypothetical protein